MEFYTITIKSKRKKLVAIYEIILEALMRSQYIDLPEENLSDPNNYLLPSVVQLKLYYTPPDIDEYNAALGLGAEGVLIDWRSVFDDEGRRGGHRYRHVQTKQDSRL